MRRGTTPTLTLSVTNLETTSLSKIEVALKQKDKLLIKEGTLQENGTIIINLSQEETLYFDFGIVNIQCKFKYINDEVVATNIIGKNMEEILNEVVI